MNCEKCRWYKRTYPVYTFGEFSARCLLGGCDESRYVPRDGKDEGIVGRKWKGATMIKLSDEDCETLIAFIKMHEREEIPDDVWDLCMRLYDAVYEEGD